MDGERLGPYRLLAELGTGGMGRVYRAEVVDRAPGLEPGSTVAVKVIHAHLLETPGFFKRFLREADIGRTIEHENVVRTYDCDALLHDGTQQNFLVMEFVRGQTLRDLLNELERVPEALCRHIGREVAKGLAAIHEAGVVHRDLKPENVLITPAHDVKVMDLGVAHLQAEAVRLSQTGAFVGSLTYAAPEQFRAADDAPDGRADLHALGVVLYELATGQHPFRSEDLSTAMRMILEETPRRAGELNPQLSPFFEEVVQGLIEKDRERRLGPAREVAAILDEGERSDWWRRRARTLQRETRRPLRRIRVPRETALYGRDDDLARLRALHERAKAGDGRVLLVEGEAGIGKTRLIDELVGRLRESGEDVAFLYGSYAPGGAATASSAFAEALREHLGPEGLEEALRSHLAVTPLLVPAFAALLRGDATPTGAEPLTKDSLQTVLVRTVHGLAAERPTIVWIDDLHFAPADGRALFTSLALAAPEHRVLLAGTMRPGVPEEWTAAITRLDHAEHRSLSRLGLDDFSALLRDAFRSERLAHELGAKIAEKSDGNPFFAFEIIRSLREGRFIARQEDGTWAATRTIDDLRMPSSVLDLVSARVAELTEDERELLDVGACCGFEFDGTLVAAVLGERRIPILRRLGRIEKKHRLVQAVGRRHVFDHHQVQEALYRGLSEVLREEYHVAIADALVARAGEKAAPDDLEGSLSVAICEHYLEGGHGERAVASLDAALRHLEMGFDNERAIRLAERALEVPGLLEGADRCRVLLRKNERLELLGRREAQEAVLTEARAAAEQAGATSCLAEVERKTGGLLWFQGRNEEAREHAARDLALSRETGDRCGEALAAMNLGGIALNEGHLPEAREHLARSVALAQEAGDRRIEARATGSLGHVLYAQGRLAEAQAHHERHLALARETGDRRGEGWAAGNLGLLLVGLGRNEEARPHHEHHLGVARATGDRRGEGIALGNLGILESGLGRHGEALAHYERSIAIAREVRGRDIEISGQLGLGSVWRTLGQTSRARRALEACLDLCRTSGTRRWEGYALADLGAVADEEGDATAARTWLDEALALHRRDGDEYGLANALTQLGDLLRRTGDAAGTRAALEEAVDLLRAQQRKAPLVAALALLARLPEGDLEAAEAAWEDAGASGESVPIRYALWKASGRLEHLAAAKRLLAQLVEHAPAAYRASMLEHVRLHREVMHAWAEHERAEVGGGPSQDPA